MGGVGINAGDVGDTGVDADANAGGVDVDADGANTGALVTLQVRRYFALVVAGGSGLSDRA